MNYIFYFLSLLALYSSCTSTTSKESGNDFSDRCEDARKRGIEKAKLTIEQKSFFYLLELEHEKIDEAIEEIMQGKLRENNIEIDYYSTCQSPVVFCKEVGRKKAMDKAIADEFGINYLDSIYALSQRIHIERLRVKDSIVSKYCDNKIEIINSISYRPIVYFLQKEIEKTNVSFYFLENIINSSVLKFEIKVDKEGRVNQLKFTEKKYNLYEGAEQKRRVELFIEKMFLNKKIYPPCILQGELEKVIKKEFVAFRWKE